MRRGGTILVVLGAFFLTLAPLARFYVSDRIVQAPRDYYQKVELVAAGAARYDGLKNKLVEGIQIKAINTILGDVRAGNAETAVWRVNNSIYDEKTNVRLDLQQYTMAFDRRTSELVNCCTATIGDDPSIKQAGFGMILPVANVQKKSYQVFDFETARTWPMRFDGIERIQGVVAYRFVQHVEPTLIAKSKRKVPAQLVGLSPEADAVKVERYYEATVTRWYDPRTGIPIKHREQIHSTLRSAAGDEGTALEADLVTTEASQKALAASSDDYAGDYLFWREQVPGWSLVLGLLMLAIGGISTLFSSAKPKRPAPAPVQVEPVPVGEPFIPGIGPKS